MAIARIEVLAGLSRAERRARIEAVRGALVEALRVPADDPTVHLVELDAENVILPRDTSRQYTVVEITLFAGRSLDAKRNLYQKLFGALDAIGIASADILVVLIESPTQNWGVQGGVPASEVEIGFEIEI